MAHMMYSQHHATMAPPQKPETFMLSSEAQQSLPQDAQVALQQVDNCKQTSLSLSITQDLIADKHLQ
jgi:transcription factor STE12